MTVRSLVQLPHLLLGLLLVLGVPLLVVAVQALIRRFWPVIVEGKHNDVAGFLIAVVGVLYAVTLAFIVIVAWEEFRTAHETVDQEAGALRSLFRDTQALAEPTRTQMHDLVVSYGEEVSVGEWKAMDDGGSSRKVFDLVGDMFTTLHDANVTSQTQATFLDDSLARLNDVAQSRAKRLSAAAEGPPAVLWAAIVVGGVVTIGFALLFGVPNERLHYLMVGMFAAVIALQVFTILALSFPYTGDTSVSPEPFERVVADFGR